MAKDLLEVIVEEDLSPGFMIGRIDGKSGSVISLHFETAMYGADVRPEYDTIPIGDSEAPLFKVKNSKHNEYVIPLQSTDSEYMHN